MSQRHVRNAGNLFEIIKAIAHPLCDLSGEDEDLDVVKGDAGLCDRIAALIEEARCRKIETQIVPLDTILGSKDLIAFFRLALAPAVIPTSVGISARKDTGWSLPRT